MVNYLPIAIFWTFVVWAQFSRGPGVLYLFFGSMPFGAFAVIPPALTGGLTFTATPMVSLLLIARAFLRRDGPATFASLAVLPQRLMLLFLFWVVAMITAAFMPRLFSGEVLVVLVRGAVSAPTALFPTVQNLSQSVYMTIAILSVFALTTILRAEAMRQHALRAMAFGAGVTIGTGLLDYAAYYLPLQPVLAPFRTATYALLTDVEVLGGKRVVGLMPEASAYGSLCLAYLCSLYFYRRAVRDDRLRDVTIPCLVGVLIVCCWLSTSTGTYVGIGLFLLTAALEWFLRANAVSASSAPYRRGLIGELSVVATLLVLLTLGLIVKPTLFDPIYALIDRMVLQKGSSFSYEQRGMWREVSLASLRDTFGMGVGLGSTRASSSLVAIFSTTGVLGGLLYACFLLQTFLRSSIGRPIEAQLIISAFRFSFLPTFIISLMNAEAVFDGMTAFGFAIVAAVAIGERRRQAPMRPTPFPAAWISAHG